MTMSDDDLEIVPSQLLALLAPGTRAPTLEDALGLLESASDLGVSEIEPLTPEREDAEWELLLSIRVEGRAEPARARAWLAPAPKDFLLEGVSWRGVTQNDLALAEESQWALGTELSFGGHPLRDFHAHVRLLAALTSDVALVLDTNAVAPRSSRWLREVALAQTPPSPSTLFTIHDVGDSDTGPHWLHTHGLDRAGVIELDALEVPAEGTASVGQLLNALASLLLETGSPPPDEPFYGGEEIELLWLPWREAVEKIARDVPGGAKDRLDPFHSRGRGVLFRPVEAASGRKYESIASYLPLLERDPLFYVSSYESERMALFASERLPRFLDLLSRFGQESDWVFLVKLGYDADGAEEREDREHLWFRVHAQSPGGVDATLLNQPYRVASLSEGMRGQHSLDLLSDWGVMSPHGRFGPDNVLELERLLGERGALH
jgi:hypothetical protein